MLIVSANLARYIPDGLVIRQPELNAISLEVGRGIWKDIAKHFRAMGAASKSRHYWQEAQAGIGQPKLEGNKAVISIGHRGVRMHWLGTERALGGPLKPKPPRKALLIPFKRTRGADKDSPILRKSLSEWRKQNNVPDEDLASWSSGSGKAPVLYWIKERKRKGKGTGKHDLIPLGVLLRSVTIEPTPEVMPSNSELTATAQASAAKYLRAKPR